MSDILIELEKLVAEWRNYALSQVPAHYADRNLHQKYLKMDNEAAGVDWCADEIEELIKTYQSNIDKG